VHATAPDDDADGTTEVQTGEEHDLSRFKKMLLGAVATMVLAAGVAVSPASATVPSIGNTGVNENANVPYLAWRGEHVRIGFCVTPNTSAALVPGAGYIAGWSIADWSGDPANGSIAVPFEVPGTAMTNADGNCYYTTFSSEKAGIAFIKLGLNDPKTHLPVYFHQFNVIWMDLLKPTATIIGDSSINPADACPPERLAANLDKNHIISWGGFPVCDPKIDPNHRVQILIKGNVPLLSNYTKEWKLGDHITLPDDWAKLAAVAAACTAVPEIDPFGNSPTCHTAADAMTNWDIHDNSLPTEGHVKTLGTQCVLADETNPAGTTDAVDNCTDPSTAAGPFSTIFGTKTTPDTWGPYDPMFPAQTLLSDGTLDSSDAPMPAARIDVTIRENNPAVKNDISGVGYLEESWKTDVYSRDALGTEKAHNLFAPYYSQYIPATTRPEIGGVLPTGTDGATPSGFNGYLVKGLYKNWDHAWDYSFHPNADSKCLNQQTYLPILKWYRPLPYGWSSVSVYTDEAGEANVNFVPGLGYYFDNLLAANKNLNNGCDLQGVNPLGTATIDAVAVYPYQPVTAANPTAEPVTFTIGNLFAKNLTVYSKGVDANGITSNSVAKIVLAHAQDIDGSPLAYEQVCWMADHNAAGFRVFAGDLPTADPKVFITLDPWHALFTTGKDPWGIDRLCTYTDLNGNTAIEVYNSNKTPVDVIAEFVNEGLIRDTVANFANKGVTGNVTSADGPPTTHVPTPAQLSQAVAIGATGPVVTPAKAAPFKIIKAAKKALAKKVLHKIRFARVVTPFHGKAKLQVRVNGKPGLVKLRITIKQGKKTVVVTRFVPSNRKVAVKNLAIPAKTAKVTVSLLSL
jgi:hypothetical protein